MGSDDAGDRILKVRQGKVAWRQFGEEVVLLDLSDSTYLATNESATALWHLLEQGTTQPALVAELVQKFSIDEQAASSDVEAFLKECRRRGLLDGDAEGL